MKTMDAFPALSKKRGLRVEGICENAVGLAAEIREIPPLEVLYDHSREQQQLCRDAAKPQNSVYAVLPHN
jgi:hypothetical protein